MEILNLSRLGPHALTLIRSKPRGVKTGFKSLDKFCGGLVNGGYNVIAGRPSMGKTSLMLQGMLQMALAGKKCMFFSVETNKYSISERIMSNLAKVTIKDLYETEHSSKVKAQLDMGLKLFSRLNVWVDFDSHVCPSQVRERAMKCQEKFGLDAVFIDYLQIMKPNEHSLQGQLKAAHISQELKAIGKELDVPMVILSQLNRGNEGRDDRRPRMSDIRDSGAIEQDADMMWLLHREDYYREREETHPQLDGICEVIIAKNKQGQCGAVNLGWQPEYFYFFDC